MMRRIVVGVVSRCSGGKVGKFEWEKLTVAEFGRIVLYIIVSCGSWMYQT